MASSRKVANHVQLTLAGSISTILVLFLIKYGLRRTGRGDLANDL